MPTRFEFLSLLTALLAACQMLVGGACAAQAENFHFPPRAEATTDSAIAAPVTDACRRQLKSRRILLLVGELQGDQWLTAQSRYTPLLQIIDTRLRALGFQIYSPEQIKASIAQGEIDAYFKNDPDAALGASKRLGANFVLRGAISSQAGVNPVVQVNEVSVHLDMTLAALDGRTISDVSARADSYSGSDTLHTALALVKEQADRLVAQLANDYCRTGNAH